MDSHNLATSSWFKDLCDGATEDTAPVWGPGCDSSDCLYCQYKAKGMLPSVLQGSKLSNILRKRSLPGQKGSGWLPDKPHASSDQQQARDSIGVPASSTEASLPTAGPSTSTQLVGKRSKLNNSGVQSNLPLPVQVAPVAATPCGSLARTSSDVNEGPDTSSGEAGATCSPDRDRQGAVVLTSQREGWRFEPEFQGRETPAPAEFQPLASLTNSTACGQGSADIICALDFSHDGLLLASAGVAKQIFLYSLSSLFEAGDLDPGQVSAATPAGSSTSSTTSSPSSSSASPSRSSSSSYLAAVHRMPSKLSSLTWVPGLDGVVTAGDYDGVLTQVDLCSGHVFAELEAHEGRRVWSVAHSLLLPNLCASASDDRTVRLWGGRGLSQQVAVLCPNSRASACGVDFSPCCEHLLALASSDHSVYLYDLRRTAQPLLTLSHHQRPVSYVKFLGADRLVSASTDAKLALWTITGNNTSASLEEEVNTSNAPASSNTAAGVGRPAAPAGCESAAAGSAAELRAASSPVPVPAPALPSCDALGAAGVCTWEACSTSPSKLFQGHRNEKNFVGLAVRAHDGLLACGSETSQVFAYHTSWSDPLAWAELEDAAEDRASRSCDAASSHAVAHSNGSACGGGACASTNLQRISGTACNGGLFVSAVCWQPAAAAHALSMPPLLAAATSSGAVHLLRLNKPLQTS